MALSNYKDQNGETVFAEPVRKGESLKLYLYRPDGYHEGGQWFTSGKIKYPDEEITSAQAKERADVAMRNKTEIRICNGGDHLVFHANKGAVIYPFGVTPEEFWSEV